MRGVTETIRRAWRPGDSAPAQAAKVAKVNTIDAAARVLKELNLRHCEPARTPPMNRRRAIGSFDSHTFSNRAGKRTDKLFLLAEVSEAPPLVLMSHGCTQCADGFAVGTRINQLAEQNGFLVGYPKQDTNANPTTCWSWFKAPDQVRDSGEPSLIAGIARSGLPLWLCK